MPSELEAGFQFLTENSIDIICRAQMDMVLSYVSPSSFHVLGWLPAEMVGERWDAFFLPEDAAPITGCFSSMTDRSPLTVRMRKKNGGSAWVEVRCRAVSASEIIIMMRDISERKSLAEKLSALEGNDARTGLSTPRALEEALDREWSRMVRDGSQLSLLLLDFNGFRQFHSGSNHFEGDRCLPDIATAIQPVLRLTDAAAHYRAEQIAILLSATGANGAATVAGKLRSAIQGLRPRRRDRADDRNEIAVHIGIASTRARSAAPNRMPELLLLAAESALHKAIERDTALVSGPASLTESARLPFER
jgi:diguanylate cyclase (GGDEF)-like protein/PAS domain S-box-containing protein